MIEATLFREQTAFLKNGTFAERKTRIHFHSDPNSCQHYVAIKTLKEKAQERPGKLGFALRYKKIIITDSNHVNHIVYANRRSLAKRTRSLSTLGTFFRSNKSICQRIQTKANRLKPPDEIEKIFSQFAISSLTKTTDLDYDELWEIAQKIVGIQMDAPLHSEIFNTSKNHTVTIELRPQVSYIHLNKFLGFGMDKIATVSLSSEKEAVACLHVRKEEIGHLSELPNAPNRKKEDIQDSAQSMIQEVQFFQTFSKIPHTLHLKEYIKADELSDTRLMVEYCDLGPLAKKHFHTLSDRSKWQIFLTILESVYGIQQKGYIHVDLKPANIMLQTQPDGSIQTKVCDFGIMRRIGDKVTVFGNGYLNGTPAYCPPEMHWKTMELGLAPPQFTDKTNVWNLGVIALEAFLGIKPPWVAEYDGIEPIPIDENKWDQFWMDVFKDPSFLPDMPTYHTRAPNCITSLINQMLIPDPHKRIGMAQLVEEFRIAIGEL